MRTRRPSPEHEAAISRRLALLGEELSGVRSARPAPPTAEELTEGLAERPWWDDHTRPAASRRPPPSRPEPRPLPGMAPAVPVPGRHASRRPGRVALSRVVLGPAQLAAVAVVVALALAVTCWWVVRGDAEPVEDVRAAPAPGLVTVAEPTARPDAAQTAGTGSETGSGSGTTPATVTVDVAGKVRRPGIAVLDAGSRVVDALAAAGGAKAGVDLMGLNLARVLVDGEQVLVGEPAPAGAAAAASPPAGQTPTGGPATLVNLNTATAAELDTLPQVGPVTATSILAWRDEHGGFTSVDELLEVDGIGEVTLGRIAPFVTV